MLLDTPGTKLREADIRRPELGRARCGSASGPAASAGPCDRARFTGYTVDGGFAEEAVADARYCLPLPNGTSDEQLAPLLCAGLIGHLAVRGAAVLSVADQPPDAT
jgi:D-arabinose 1-dehydrogenase-like Zn-dependent alcohol dehydrogenase